MFVHGVAVIKVTHHQRIDQPELREDFHQEPQPLHRAQRQARVVRAQDFAQLFPRHFLVLGWKLRVDQDISDAAFPFTAQLSARTRALSEKGIGNRAVGKSRKIHHFQQSIAHLEIFPVAGFDSRCARGIPEPLAQRQRDRCFLFEVAQELPVQRSRMAKILPHPVRWRTRNAVADSQSMLRRGFLQFVGQRVVVAPVGVMQETSRRAEKINRGRAHLFFGRGDVANSLFLFRELPQPDGRLVVAHSARRLFHVGLQVENRVPITRQAVSRKFVQLCQHKGPGLFLRARQHLFVQFFEKA